ncbi:hypothetical protein VTK26DRAFT_1535 [Humicola hyalothermophila]
MARFAIGFIAASALLSAAGAWPNVPGHTFDPNGGVQNYTKHIEFGPQTGVATAPPAPRPKADANKSTGQVEAQDSGIDCLFPGLSGSAHMEDCNVICSHFLSHPNDYVWVRPVDQVNWAYATCQFGLANLNPCREEAIQLGQLTGWCQGMMATCIINGYDAIYRHDGSPWMAALTGDDAAPPYPSPPAC